MNQSATWEQITRLIDIYVETIRNELRERWKHWPLDLAKKEMYEAIGALLARQVSLATHLALSPPVWNGHIAPLVLRSMTDAYITLAWIFQDPVARSVKFIEFGLGQAKLQLEHRKKQLEDDGRVSKDDPLIRGTEDWINEQRLADLTEVHVGAWAGLDTRKMVEEAGCIDLYNYAYSPFSSATHNMWSHIATHNLERCPNPLHRYHMIPIDRLISPDIDFVYRAAKYVEKSFKLFEEKTGVRLEGKSAFQSLAEALDEMSRKSDQEQYGEERPKDGSKGNENST